VAATATHHLVTPHARAFHQPHHLLDALFVSGVAEVQANEDRRLRICGCGGAV
jgi:hypothetical protein